MGSPNIHLMTQMGNPGDPPLTLCSPSLAYSVTARSEDCLLVLALSPPILPPRPRTPALARISFPPGPVPTHTPAFASQVASSLHCLPA